MSKIRVVQRGGARLCSGHSDHGNYLPVICRETADGGFEAVPELVDLLEDPVITLYYLGERPKELISAVQLPGQALRRLDGRGGGAGDARVRGRVGHICPRDGRRAAGRGRHPEGYSSIGRIKNHIKQPA